MTLEREQIYWYIMLSMTVAILLLIAFYTSEQSNRCIMKGGVLKGSACIKREYIITDY